MLDGHTRLCSVLVEHLLPVKGIKVRKTSAHSCSWPAATFRLLGAVCLAAMTQPLISSASDLVPFPSITGPTASGDRERPFSSSFTDLKEYGYEEVEYFISGSARSYAPVPGTHLGTDGRWSVAPENPKEYKTR